MTNTIAKYSSSCLLSHVFAREKDKQKLKMIEKINIDTQIIAVVKDDPKY